MIIPFQSKTKLHLESLADILSRVGGNGAEGVSL
jgi:hypothetical protein